MFDEEDSKFIEEFLKEMNIIEGKENVRNEIIKLHKERSLDLDNEFISNNLLSMMIALVFLWDMKIIILYLKNLMASI